MYHHHHQQTVLTRKRFVCSHRQLPYYFDLPSSLSVVSKEDEVLTTTKSYELNFYFKLFG
jgi:hypothetical protein